MHGPSKCFASYWYFRKYPYTRVVSVELHIGNYNGMLPFYMQYVHSYSPDLKNAEGVTPLELASSPNLQKALRTHLNINSPEKFSNNQNAVAPPENETEMSACAMEATKVDETQEGMFADQESVEQEEFEPPRDIDQLDAELVGAEKDIVNDQSIETVTEEEEPQESGPLEDSVEEISIHIEENMEVDVKVEPDEEANVHEAESKADNMEHHPAVAAAASPDSNKENLGSSSLDSDLQEKVEEDKEKSPNMMMGGLRKPKNPFTEIRRSTSSSRAAMMVSECVYGLKSHFSMIYVRCHLQQGDVPAWILSHLPARRSSAQR